MISYPLLEDKRRHLKNGGIWPAKAIPLKDLLTLYVILEADQLSTFGSGFISVANVAMSPGDIPYMIGR